MKESLNSTVSTSYLYVFFIVEEEKVRFFLIPATFENSWFPVKRVLSGGDIVAFLGKSQYFYLVSSH